MMMLKKEREREKEIGRVRQNEGLTVCWDA